MLSHGDSKRQRFSVLAESTFARHESLLLQARVRIVGQIYTQPIPESSCRWEQGVKDVISFGLHRHDAQ